MSHDEQDRLWAMAPEHAALGVVVSPRGLALVERAAVAITELLGSSPDFAQLNSVVMHELLQGLGSTNPTLAGYGMTHDAGFALFLVDDQMVLALPVGDRDKFLAAIHGTRGSDGDVIGAWVCKPVEQRYVCVQRRALLGQLGRGGLDATRRTLRVRGDIEVVGRGVASPLAERITAAVELDRGTVMVHGTLGRVAPAVLSKLGTPSRPRADAAGAAGFGVIDLTPALSTLPRTPIARGVTVADLGRSVAGPITYVVAAGTSDPAIRIPLGDLAPAKEIVEHCAEIPDLARMGTTVHDGVCRVPIPGTAAVFEGWVEGKELRIGHKGAIGQANLVAPTHLARELAEGKWSAAFFGRGNQLDVGQLHSQLPLPIGAEGAERVWMLLSELGAGIRKDGEDVQFVLGARTAWSNPDDVLQKLLAISHDDLIAGKADALVRALTAAAPHSPLADDVRAGSNGLVSMSTAVGLVAALAIPALMDVMKRARFMPAEVHLAAGDRAATRSQFSLAGLHAGMHTTIFMKADRSAAPDPPRGVFVKTHYRRGSAELVAYETPPRPGARRPAIIWIHGGFAWDIDGDLWKPRPRSNDQTAAALRQPGIVVMYPALRGFNGNPGKPECFFGEVDDILAAAEHLAKRPDVDPARIYLGGHSTGGTLALLAAASTDRFRAVFAFGPIADPREYGDMGCLPEGMPPREYIARAPMRWTGSIVVPTLVVEGEHGNADAFPALAERASPAVKFALIADADHFTALAPGVEAIARAILADTGPSTSITLDIAAIARSAEKRAD